MNGDDDFRLELSGPARLDVFLVPPGDRPPYELVEHLDRAGVRVVGDLSGADPGRDRLRRILRGCAGVLSFGPECDAVRIARELRLPVRILPAGATTVTDLEPLYRTMLACRPRIPPYAFAIGRLERDFAHAREAIRAAVWAEAGIDCLWGDDPGHRSSVTSVPEETRQLIRHASFVIADLTLGVESPRRENPSRAHEVGMAIAYDRPLMLSSREPRRSLYFSICDRQMTFWATEDELREQVGAWIRMHRETLGRRVFNHELPATAGPARLGRPEFHLDRRRSYRGPHERTLGARLATLVDSVTSAHRR